MPHPVTGAERFPASFRAARPTPRALPRSPYAAAAREGRRRRPRPRAGGVEQVVHPPGRVRPTRPGATWLGQQAGVDSCGEGWRGRSGATRWPCPGAVRVCVCVSFLFRLTFVVGSVDIGDLSVLRGYVQCETCNPAGGQQVTEVWHSFIIYYYVLQNLCRVNLKPGAPADVRVNNHCSRTLTSFAETWLSGSI